MWKSLTEAEQSRRSLSLHQNSRMSKQEANTQRTVEEADDGPDDWDRRIFSTGCSEEQFKMNDCYYAKKDWRACKEEMEVFRKCWKRNGNHARTDMKDA